MMAEDFLRITERGIEIYLQEELYIIEAGVEVKVVQDRVKLNKKLTV